MLLRPVDAGAGVIACCRATRGGRRTLELSRTTRVARGRSDVAFVTGTGAASMTFAGTARATTMGVGVRRFTTPASGRARDKTSRGGPDTSESCFWSGVACTAMGDTATVSWLGSGSAGRCTDAWLTVILPGRMVLATYPVAAHARIIGREMYRGTRWLDSEARQLMGAFPDAIRTNRLGLNRSIGHTFPNGCVNLRRTRAPARIRNFPERGLMRMTGVSSTPQLTKFHHLPALAACIFRCDAR